MVSGSELGSPARSEPEEDPVFFAADTHFGTSAHADERDRVDRFVRFLHHVRENGRALYIAGDLFDFWFEYTHVLPRAPILVFAELAALVEAGVKVTYLAGNHDFWIDRFFTDTFGVHVRHGAVDLRIQGRRIFLTHGDDLTAGHDPGYRFLRRIVRSSFAIRAFHWIHPDIGIPLARWASRRSRAHTNRRKFLLNRTLERAVRERFEAGYDAIIMGHVHFAEVFRYEKGECVILGDWIEAYSYAEMTGGVITLKRWEG
jgi:UDP-2,3-diacylglucosamine hydrolase